jgi:hypothetical protein
VWLSRRKQADELPRQRCKSGAAACTVLRWRKIRAGAGASRGVCTGVENVSDMDLTPHHPAAMSTGRQTGTAAAFAKQTLKKKSSAAAPVDKRTT